MRNRIVTLSHLPVAILIGIMQLLVGCEEEKEWPAQVQNIEARSFSEFEESPPAEEIREQGQTTYLAGQEVSLTLKSIKQHRETIEMLTVHSYLDDFKDHDLFLAVSISDPQTGEIVRDADFRIEIYGPAGDRLETVHDLAANQTIYYEGFALANQGKGKYRVTLTVRINEKQESGEILFDLKES